MKIKHILPVLLLTTTIMTFLTGCDEVQIFENKTDPNALVALKDTELKDDKYYVKNNTRFYEVYMPETGNASSEVSVLNESRVIATMLDDQKIPTHYSDELIAFQSEKIDFTEVSLERFIDLGYSIGCFNGELTGDGLLYFNKQEGLVENSSLANAIGDTQSTDIRIASIDGKQLTRDQINTKAGVIIGLEKQKTYKIGFYIGTRYYEKNVEADCKMYEAYEMFTYGQDNISDTPNGYMCFNTPTELKCGYYNINGKGLFKYYNFTRGSQDENEVDMNESFYKDEKSKIEAYSRQYSIDVPKRVKDFKIIVKYQDSELKFQGDTIQGIVFAPDRTRMDMTHDEKAKELTLSMVEGMAGDWTVNVIPKTLDIKDVTVEKDDAAEEATCEETVFTLPEDRENVEFIAEYTTTKADVKDCTVFGTILTEDGKTYEMTVWSDESDKTNVKHYISYEVPFAAAGDYTVRIYHYPEETTILAPVVQDKVETDTEIIIIDG